MPIQFSAYTALEKIPSNTPGGAVYIALLFLLLTVLRVFVFSADARAARAAAKTARAEKRAEKAADRRQYFHTPLWQKYLTHLHAANPAAFLRAYNFLLGAGDFFLPLTLLIFFLGLFFSAVAIVSPLFGAESTWPAYLLALVSGILAVYAALLYINLSRMHSQQPEDNQLNLSRHLFILQLAKEAAQKAGVPAPMGVYIDNGTNCAVNERPDGRGQKGENLLSVGVWLFGLLSAQELEAVFLQAYMRLFHPTALPNRKAERKRAVWGYRLALYEKSKYMGGLLRAYAKGYFAKLNICQALANKTAEHQADLAAAEHMGAQMLGTALLKINLFTLYNGKDLSLLRALPEPPEKYCQFEFESFQKDLPGCAPTLLKELMQQKSGAYDSPSFSHRLENLGLNAAELPLDFSATLEGIAADVLNDHNKEWLAYWKANWNSFTEKYKYALATIEDYNHTESPTFYERQCYARALLAAGKEEEAQGQYALLLAEKPDCAAALFFEGTRLLREGAEEGVALLQRAAEKEIWMTDDVLQTLSLYFYQTGQPKKWQALKPFVTHRHKQWLGRQPYLFYNIKSRLQEAETPFSLRGKIENALRLGTAIASAYIACKEQSHTQTPVYVIVVCLTDRHYTAKDIPNRAEIESVLDALDIFYILFLARNIPGTLEKMLEVPGSCLFDRQNEPGGNGAEKPEG